LSPVVETNIFQNPLPSLGIVGDSGVGTSHLHVGVDVFSMILDPSSELHLSSEHYGFHTAPRSPMIDELVIDEWSRRVDFSRVKVPNNVSRLFLLGFLYVESTGRKM
jgi:hypothetical protein